MPESKTGWDDVPRIALGERVPGYREAVRPTCRGIVELPDGRLLMTTTDEYGEYVFAGGGVEPGETDLEALVREVSEETGYAVDPASVRPYLYVEDVRCRHDLRLNMNMVSKYFTCRAEKAGEPHLDEREAATGLRPCALTVREAYDANAALLAGTPLFWVERDQLVLERLLTG